MSPRIIEVAAPSTELTVQDLYDTLRTLAADEGIDEPEITDGSGKEDLGGGTFVGLTVKLLNAKVKFEDRASPTDCDIFGGNLVAVDENGNSMNPIQYATNVTVTYAKSSSATISELGDVAQEASVQDLRDKVGIPTSTLAGDIDSVQEKTQDLGENLEEIKGPEWTDETLKLIKELVGKGKASFRG